MTFFYSERGRLERRGLVSALAMAMAMAIESEEGMVDKESHTSHVAGCLIRKSGDLTSQDLVRCGRLNLRIL